MSEKMPPPPDKAARRAEALKANLKRRKAGREEKPEDKR
jgi:hypothetical protein